MGKLSPEEIKRRHPDINVVTDAGNIVVLRWMGTEYRAYHESQDLRLGSILPNSLINYVKKNC